MSRIRKLIIAMCILSAVAFGAFNVWHYMSRDVEPPKITMDKEEIRVSIKADEQELLEGIKAEDGHEGDVTATLGVEKLSAFGADGTRRMTVVAFDGQGNTARAVRKIRYTDYTHPRFILKGPLLMDVNSGRESVSSLVQVNDCLDGDITDRMSFRYDKNDKIGPKGGDFPVSFEVTNSAGDDQKIECTATLLTQQRYYQSPIVVLEQNIVYTDKGKELDPMDYVTQVDYNGKKYSVVNEGGAFGKGTGQENAIDRDRIEIEEDVDYDKPGSYEIAYSVSDGQGSKGTVRLIVVVEDKQ